MVNPRDIAGERKKKQQQQNKAKQKQKTGTPVASLQGAWRYWVITGTGCPVSVYCDWVRKKF